MQLLNPSLLKQVAGAEISFDPMNATASMTLAPNDPPQGSYLLGNYVFSPIEICTFGQAPCFQAFLAPLFLDLTDNGTAIVLIDGIQNLNTTSYTVQYL